MNLLKIRISLNGRGSPSDGLATLAGCSRSFNVKYVRSGGVWLSGHSDEEGLPRLLSLMLASVFQVGTLRLLSNRWKTYTTR